MAELSSEFIKKLVTATQDIELDDVAASRVAKASAQAIRTLDAKAGQSLFDTEPAKFAAMLANFAENPNNDD